MSASAHEVQSSISKVKRQDFAKELDTRDAQVRILRGALAFAESEMLYEIFPGINGNIRITNFDGLPMERIKHHIQNDGVGSLENELQLLWNSAIGEKKVAPKKDEFFKEYFYPVDLTLNFVMRIPSTDGGERRTCHVDIQFLGVQLPADEALKIKTNNPELFKPKTSLSCQIS
ncbi:hypothetical protein Lmor_1769 [Legionella moravica]|uniref:Uncharacterized protein n=1 Tax=Legionella moravica TaxID=39962 RepID=A0A378K1C9_9GAMM|nr:hypothetical protein [Legionella moravica]KTD34372.1 hypothetical protein Lmor_1769 [Legionella moravica]STX64090.1 Uncharacterised protein [Legionella moravica]